MRKVSTPEVRLALIVSSFCLFGACHSDAGNDEEEGSRDPDVQAPPALAEDPDVVECEARIIEAEYRKTFDALASYLATLGECRELIPELKIHQKFVLIDSDISNVDLFKFAYNARSIDLSSNRITSIDGLGVLTFLQQLYLNNNFISNIAALVDLTPSLDSLEIGNNPLGTTVAVSEENCPTAGVGEALVWRTNACA